MAVWCAAWSTHSEPSLLLSYADGLVALTAEHENWPIGTREGWCAAAGVLAVLGRGEQGLLIHQRLAMWRTLGPTSEVLDAHHVG